MTRSTDSPPVIDYLIAPFRISIGPDSTTPGPRTHIRGLCDAWARGGATVRPFLVSSVVGLRGFRSISETSYQSSSDLKVWVADAVRLAASLWAGVSLWISRIARPAPTIIIERSGVLQSLTSFHPKKRGAVRVVEANGINSRETVVDRNVLKSVRLATALERRVFRRADLVIAVSNNLKTELLDFAGLDPRRVLVVPNGCDERVTLLPRHDGDDCIIGFVGALSPWSHLERMLRVFMSQLPALELIAGTKVRLEVIGDGVDRRRLEEVRQELGAAAHVTLWGAKSHEAALQIMTSWHIGFAGHEQSSSSTMYHSPLKVYEYAGLGLITVCTYSDDADSLRSAGVPTYYFSSSDGLGEALIAAVTARREQTPGMVEARRSRVRTEHSWSRRAWRTVERVLGEIEATA